MTRIDFDSDSEDDLSQLIIERVNDEQPTLIQHPSGGPGCLLMEGVVHFLPSADHPDPMMSYVPSNSTDPTFGALIWVEDHRFTAFKVPLAAKLSERRRVTRVAVGRPGFRGTIWRIWTNKDDIYVASRKTAGDWKLSLHQSGTWRFALTEAASVKGSGSTADQLPDRAIGRWRRPDADGGWYPACSIILPADHLREVTNDQEKSDRWLDPPDAGDVVEIMIACAAEPGTYPVSLGETFTRYALPVAALVTPNGTCMVVVAVARTPEPEEASAIADATTKFSPVPTFYSDLGIRALVWDTDSGHGPRFLDLAGEYAENH